MVLVTVPEARSRSRPLIGGAGNSGNCGGPKVPVSGDFGNFGRGHLRGAVAPYGISYLAEPPKPEVPDMRHHANYQSGERCKVP